MAKQQKIYNLRPWTNTPVDDVRSIGIDPNDVKYVIARYEEQSFPPFEPTIHLTQTIVMPIGTIYSQLANTTLKAPSFADEGPWNGQKMHGQNTTTAPSTLEFGTQRNVNYPSKNSCHQAKLRRTGRRSDLSKTAKISSVTGAFGSSTPLAIVPAT